jgi:serine/threonine-protein kinase
MAANRMASFIDNLRDSQLLEPKQLDEVSRNPLAQAEDPMPLARELIQRQALTAFQVNQLVRGRGKELVLGPYRIIDRIGEGGMGQVYKAYHQPMSRMVALKLIRKEKLTKPDAVSRFYQEIRAAAQLNHPNIVIAYDAGQADDTLYFAMEYVEGIDLAKLVKDKGPLPVPAACAFIRQAALGLQHAQEKGLVHRDIKPANLLLTRAPGAQAFGLVKILDFGLARLQSLDGDGAGNALTKTGMVVGTPDYLPPEQARNSRNVDIRSDLYSLGCSFFCLLAGRPPFKGEHLTEVLLQHQTDPPPPLTDYRKDVPPGVQAIISKLLAKKPEDRFQTPAELAAALAAFAGKGGKRAVAEVNVTPLPNNPVPRPGAMSETLAANPDTPDALPTLQRPGFLGRTFHGLPRGARWGLLGAAVLIPVLAILLLFAGSKKERPEARATEAARPPATRPEHFEILTAVREAVKENRLRQTKVMGGYFDSPQQEVPPDGALLIGFEVGTSRIFNAQYIASLRPIYLTTQGEKLGTLRGKDASLTVTYKAKKGYAVGAVSIRHGLLFEGLQLTFMKIGTDSLDRGDSYKSEWLGGGGSNETPVGGDGAPVVGVLTKENGNGGLTGLGLVLVKRRD